MTRIRPRILLGNDLAARSRDLLYAHHVSHVLNCGRTAEHFRGEPDSPVYLSLGLRDDVAINGDELHEQLLHAVGFISRFLEQEDETSVLVHCREGISRSCGVMLAYLMVTEDLELSAAMEELRGLHQKCDPNLGILMALQDWKEWYHAAIAAGRGVQLSEELQSECAEPMDI
jgi:protein-tyrosine phosphatase